MTTITKESALIDAADAEAAAMWQPGSLTTARRGEPFMKSAEAIHAGERWAETSGAITTFDEPERSCVVRVTASPTEADAHVTAEVIDRHGRPDHDYRIEATVRTSWIRRMTAGSRDGAAAAIRIVASLEDLARLPGQSTVRITQRTGRTVRIA